MSSSARLALAAQSSPKPGQNLRTVEPADQGTPRDLANLLIRAADSAMYEAKALGKNTVIMAPATSREACS